MHTFPRPMGIKHSKIASAITAVAILSGNASAFTAREVTVFNQPAGITLAGTLTAPGDGERVRGVIVMATGSGTQDRDETLFGHKPFKVIAENLSDAGYAVLRMDDRGAGGSEGDPSTAVTDDFVTDVLAGLGYARELYPGVQAGIIGHSEGGTIAVKAAAGNTGVSFIITIGCPALPGDSLIMSQMRALSRGATGNDDAYHKNRALQRQLLDIVKSAMPASIKRARMSMLICDTMPAEAAIPQVRKQIDSQIDGMLTPWYIAYMRYDPAGDIASVSVPWLAFNGALDLQVTPDNLDIIKCNPNATTVLMPQHNHLLQRCTTGMPDEYARISQTIDPEAIATMIQWLGTVCE